MNLEESQERIKQLEAEKVDLLEWLENRKTKSGDPHWMHIATKERVLTQAVDFINNQNNNNAEQE